MLRRVDFPSPVPSTCSLDLSPDFLAACPSIDLAESLQELDASQDSRKLSITDRFDLFEASRMALSSNSDFLARSARHGIAGFLDFISRTQLERLARASLRGPLESLDGFCSDPRSGQLLSACPRGTVVHWIPGNVPILGAISLIQSLLAGNRNVVKLPKRTGLLLPLIARTICEDEAIRVGSLTGKELFRSTLFVYCDRDDRASQEQLSEAADVRMVWGGQSAVDSVLGLTKRFECVDMAFGPKYSMAIVGRDGFGTSNLSSLCLRLAMDVCYADQQACNSPHTIMVESGGEVSPLEFAKALATGMEKATRRVPIVTRAAADGYAVTTMRARYDFDGEVFASAGTEWTVIYSDEAGLAKPAYARTVFVRPIQELNDALPHLRRGVQTVGLAVGAERRATFARDAALRGVERFQDFGRMSAYGVPWDGVFPIDQLVRWVSLPASAEHAGERRNGGEHAA